MKLRALIISCLLLAPFAVAQQYDLVILNGRVIDPESKTDLVRNIGIRGGKIVALSERPLTSAAEAAGAAKHNGSAEAQPLRKNNAEALPLRNKNDEARPARKPEVIDAKGLVVAPGFIDLHQHGQDDENYRLKAEDGVTTALELEVGVADPDSWYAARAGKALINYGASVGHIQVRMAVMHDPGTLLPIGPAAHRAATPEEIAQMKEGIERGLQHGALAVGMGLAYTEAATAYEALQVFNVAAKYHASVHVHLRTPPDRITGLQEVLADSAVSGAPLHVVHIQSTGSTDTARELEIIAEARQRGLDVTTEMYPYLAGMTEIGSAVLDLFAQDPNADFSKLMWPATGERLTRETFEKYRKQGGMVLLFTNPPEMVDAAAISPLTMIASDGAISKGVGHPRTAGTYSNILRHYVRRSDLCKLSSCANGSVRETHQLDLVTAITKMTLMPAQRLERRAPAFASKGRIKIGGDADLAIFDPNTITDRATYQQPTLPSEGMRYVLVNGVPVVREGAVVSGVFPGQGIKAPLSSEAAPKSSAH